jgi:F-type H+-transporting ATPase subunit b
MNSALALLLQAAPEAHEPQLIDIDHTIFIQLGIFLLALIILNKFLWQPYLRVRTERVERVDGYREEATRLEADAQQRLARADAALAEARRVGAGERAVARAEAHAREQTLLAEATAAAQRKLADARARLSAAIEGERKKLEGDASEVAMAAARKILGREVGA